MTNELTLWEDETKLNEVRKVCAPKLSNMEFKLYVEIGKKTQLNPFLNQIWCIKYSDKMPASIFIARDGFRIMARRNKDYKSHVVDAVYENDKFAVEDGHVKHSYSLKNRGALLGAYCKVFTKSSEVPFFTFVEIKEYNKNQGNWKTMPATMIKKVSEAQCLRMAFPDDFSNVYSDAEQWKQERELKVVNDEQYNENEQSVIDVIESDTVVNKPLSNDEIEKQMNDLFNQIQNAQSMNELKEVFQNAVKYAKAHRPEYIEGIVSEKNERKKFLESAKE